jgi:hypothetical protein
MVSVALHGFHGAKIRYDTHQHDAVPQDVIVPLAEALWWATTLDEALSKAEPGYAKRRDSSHDGRLLRAARFARNRINHQLTLAIQRTEGLRFPITFPMRFHEFLWLPVEHLPAGRRDPVGQEFYERHLAGEPVRLTLHAAAGWFASEQNQVSSPLNIGEGLQVGGDVDAPP